MNNVETLNHIIRNRRAVFPPMYTGELIEEGIIWNILENANWAPTHKRTEPWFFKVIRQDRIQELCNYGAEWYKDFTPAEHFSQAKYEKIKTKALTASHIIVLCMRRDEKKRIPKWEEEAALACAVQNMWLTITAYNLGAYWSTPGYALHGERFFGLKKKEKCLGLFYIGVPKEGLVLSAVRQDIHSKVTWF